MPDGRQRGIHGGAPEETFARLGLMPRPVLDFSASVSPLGPPPEIIALWPELLAELTRYPDVDGRGVSRYYEQSHGVPSEAVLAGNGSTECLYLVPRMLNVSRVAVVTPSFHDYGRACELAGVQCTSVRLSATDQFTAPPTALLASALRDNDALLLGNPNNPTGTLFSASSLLALADAYPDKWLWVDEAFMSFLTHPEKHSLMAQAKRRKNVLVFRSLTKFYALAGLRLGAVIGHPEVIATLRRGKEPWTVNRLAERVAEKLPACQHYEAGLRTLVHRERQRIVNRLASSTCIRLFPGSVNFMLAQWTATADLDDLLRALMMKGIHVRDARNFEGLAANFFRFAIRKPEQNDRLLEALEST